MSEIKLISPMLDNFCIGEPISDQNGVRCCPAMKENEDDRYIVKIVSIPASQTKLDALLLAGAYPNAEAANSYFKELADGFVEELNILNQLSEQDGFLPFSKWQVVPMENGDTGYDVYMLTSYKRTLKRQFYKDPLTHLNAVNLGIDMCAALTACRDAGYLFVDLKPSNIFVTPERQYKISDLGFVKMDSLQYASLPALYRSAYTAPEVVDAYSALSDTMDVYALGLVMYQTYNNGALPFSGDKAPVEAFPPPEYADYEMSEIILKACDPDPEKRWQNPAEMGQAIVSYMQRNGANDTPIVPPMPIITAIPTVTETINADELSEIQNLLGEDNAAESEEVQDTDTSESAEDSAVEPQPAEEDSSATEDDSSTDSVISQLSFLNLDDDMEPVEDQDSTYEDISSEVSQMLEQADELASHDVPDVEDVIEQEMNAPEESGEADSLPENEEQTDNTDEPVGCEETEETDESEAETNNSQSANNENTVIFNAQETTECAEDDDEANDDEIDEDEHLDNDEADKDETPVIKPKRRWLKVLIVLLIIAGLAVGAYFAYKYYYIKTVESITAEGSYDTLTVEVVSDADPSLLRVYCVGNGNSMEAQIIDGKATFKNLAPDTKYDIEVKISGLHGLKGTKTTTYRTGKQIALQELKVNVGRSDYSAMISYTANIPYEGKWKVEYLTDGEEVKSVTTDNASEVEITGLTAGKTYDITVSPVNGPEWVTNNTCTFTAQPVILAENVEIVSYNDNTLVLQWSAPENQTVESWEICSYNDADHNQTQVVYDAQFSLDYPDPSQDHTIEIRANMQTEAQIVHVQEILPRIDDFTANITDNGFIELTWSYAKQTPADGWSISYTVNGKEYDEPIETSENAYVLKDVVPGCDYTFTIKAKDDSLLIANNATLNVPKAQDYAYNYETIAITKDNIVMTMYSDQEKTTQITDGSTAKFDAYCNIYYGESDTSEVYILYVFKDKDGNLLHYNGEEKTWDTLWDMFHADLVLSELPTEPGTYTVDVYFNGGFVHSQEFEIVQPEEAAQ